MKKRRPRPTESDDRGTCLLCGGPLDFNRVVGVPGQLAEGEDVSDRVGETVYIDLSGLHVSAGVVTPGSPLHLKGFHVLFLVCGSECNAAIRLAAGLDALDATGIEPDPYAEGVTGLRLARPNVGLTDKRIGRMDRFDALLREVAPAIARRLGADRLPPRGPDDVTPAELESALDQVAHRCGWCIREIADDVPVKALLVRFRSPEDMAAGSGVAAIKLGDRLVAARVPEEGSPAAERCDAVILLCSDACATDLRAAISENEDPRLSVVQ